MAHYADQISTLPLLKQLRSSKGRDDVSPAEVELLVAMVLNTADSLGPLLDRIPLTFRQYTQHDIRHSANIITLMGRFIPKRTLKQLNAVELAILALSAIVHDAGMFVTDDEKETVVASTEYRRFEAGQGDRATLLEKARAAGEHLRAAALQDALLAEYFRRLHPERAADVVQRHLKGRLVFRDTDLSPAVLRVAESHGWGVLESNDPRDPEKSVSRLYTRRPVSNVPVNEQYLACCLRLADIMDFDRSRTPASVFQHLRFTEEKSWGEWNKHLQVRGWHIDEHEVLYSIPCSHPAFYVAVMEFLDWIDAELRDCRHLVKEAPKSVAERYELNLPAVVDRRQVEMDDPSYLAGAFRFQLDYERIMQLLMDRSLYPDPSLFLRELLQNALDACRTREAHAKAAGGAYTARIAVWDHSDDPDEPRIIFQDNGIGMSRRIVENYFMRVGRSYYKSAEFDLERQRLADQGVELEATSQFGIGILSCFMVADRFDVETHRAGDRPLHITIEGPTKYFTIRMLPEPARADFTALPPTDAHDGPPNHPGTRITVHLNRGSRFDTKAVLEQFAVNIEYEIRIHRGGASYALPAWRWRNLSVLVAEHQVGGSFYGPREYKDGIAPVVNTILIPAKVPLEEYDFASHLDGRAWFWLLRGPEGNPCPAQGFLRIGTRLQCTGLAALAGTLMEVEYDGLLDALGANIEELSADIAEAISEGHNPFDGRDVPVTHRYGEVDPRFWERLHGMWEALPEDQKPMLLNALANLERTLTSWYADENAPGELLAGTMGWAERNIATWPEIGFANPMNELALHGIRLPAGVVSWDPMKGSGKRETYLVGPGGIAVDLRRGARVKPAASRLFVDQREAASVEIPLLRACIRFGSSLAVEGGSHTVEWRRWFGEMIVPMFRDQRRAGVLKRLELPRLEKAHGYLCTFDGVQALLSREELVARCGSRMLYQAYGASEGIDNKDPLNQLMAKSRVVGKGSNYTDIVDLGQDLETVLNPVDV